MMRLRRINRLRQCKIYPVLLGSVGIPALMDIEAGDSALSLVSTDFLGDRQVR